MKGQKMNAVKETRADLRRTENGEASRNFVSPEVNIFETKNGYVLEAEMPGVGKDGLDITLEGNELTIEGRRAHETGSGEAAYRGSRGLGYRRRLLQGTGLDVPRIQ